MPSRAPRHHPFRKGKTYQPPQRRTDPQRWKPYTREWRRASREFLRQHPLCAHCLANGKRAPSREVDHITPHKGDMTLFWDPSNWQALCKPCHSRKTLGEIRHGRGGSKVSRS